MFTRDRGIILACDVPLLEELRFLVSLADANRFVCGLKIGCTLGLRYGLPTVVETIRKITDTPVIYDHQKAGTDIPAMGPPFAETVRRAGVDGIILFPQAGPETLRAFVDAVQESGATPLVGGLMTHPRYLQSDGGWILDQGPAWIYQLAVECGVTEFILPGNQPERIAYFAKQFQGSNMGISMPGIGTQGGQITEAFQAAAPHRTYAIIGSAIYAADNPRQALATFCQAVQNVDLIAR